jgi:nucleoside-diphosphate-sugar epimerase
LLEIIKRGKYTTYNIASGINTKSKEILDEISRVTNCKIKVVENGKYFSSPKISIERIREEFDFQPKSITSKLENIIKSYQEYISKN